MPEALPETGTILVRAAHYAQAGRWMLEQQPEVRRRCHYIGSVMTVLGSRPAAVVYLPQWWDHRHAVEMSDAISYAARPNLQEIHVREGV